jgi:uncharacterized protein YjiS (DUF1127 family)
MFKKFFHKIADMQERRAAYHLLHTLTDKQLKDMGITRGEIRQRVYQK